MSGLKTPAVHPRSGNGTKPKSRICRLTPSRSLTPSLVGNTPRKSAEVAESSSSSPSRSSTSPRRTSSDRKSPRRYLEERQQAHQSPKRSPRRFLSFLDDDSCHEEMGLGLRVSSTSSTCVDEGPGMSFLEFETLYTLEKQMLMQSQCNQDPVMVQLLDSKCTTTTTTTSGWFGSGGRRGVYTELPDPMLCHQVGSTSAAPVPSSQVPTEGFSFAPGWSLNADHFYQWQHRGKTTQQIYTDWANYYLERGGCKRRVTDLQADLCDGVLLADLVEAVTNQKVIDVNRKPKSAQQMVSKSHN
ncbi:hypothetical protein DMN91_009671 [Ooceraea biroi]|uniref:Calponin-homology (CH) domain-containing protein n=1 Tax=Ooceraea biroi TaxID=2015173 RepID=A0A3L8DAR9_OOCBI|nr:hypothetical protein DMN91_009671 [Ooceraea biroi]